MSDLIDRQAAIDAVDVDNLHRGIVEALQNIISELPSAEPERKTEPMSDLISRQAAIDQIRWERDIAIEQLSQIGKGLGERMDDIVKVVRCKDCKYYNTIGVCIETSSAVCEDSFCCWAERK